jgi:hypothetical protein
LERSPAIRVLAERALVALLDALDGEDAEIVVLGGLVPEVLVGSQEPPAPGHLGTTDVDILLVSHLTLEGNLGHVERALEAIGFEPGDGGWRWRGQVDGTPLKMEFLCDLETEPEHVIVPIQGCEKLKAQNLRGTGLWPRTGPGSSSKPCSRAARSRRSRLGSPSLVATSSLS